MAKILAPVTRKAGWSVCLHEARLWMEATWELLQILVSAWR